MEGFSERLREAMALRNFRQVDLVNATKIDKGLISNYLKGNYVPKNVNVILIANALKVNTLWLLGYEDVPMEIDKTVEVFPSDITDNSYTVVKWEEDLDAKISKETWASYYDKLQALPESMRFDIYKYVSLGAEMADRLMKKK